MNRHPHLFEANAFWFLRRLSQKAGKTLSLASIPDTEWKFLQDQGLDILWLMGVWKRSPGARQKALEDPRLQQTYGEVLPDWTEKDVIGSPYAVYEYRLDPFLGGQEELRELKSRLNRLGIKLMLDFVPNHLALDHPWTLSHPEYFIQRPEASVLGHPDWFYETSRGIFLAHGRDPYFPPWSDTVQLNYFSEAAREAMTGELLRISEVSDGVRCDMAMLVINDIFKRVWGPITGQPESSKEFWPSAIKRVRAKRPDFIFMAEAYWNREWILQQMGFDFTYDKTLYDRLIHSHAQDVRGHLLADLEYQKRSARFIENHDEKRAAEAFGLKRSLAAAAVTATVPGLPFFHDGQLEGRMVHVPIQLGRELREKDSPEAIHFYGRLLKMIQGPVFREGNWELREVCPAGESSETFSNLLAWSWERGAEMSIVVINYSGVRSQGRIHLPRKIRGSKKISFFDGLANIKYSYSADEINELGIYVDLDSWKSHILEGPVHEKEGGR